MSDQQPIRVPNGLAYGERGATEDLQRANPLPEARAALPPRLQNPRGRVSGGGIPDFVFNRPSDRPGEPVTEGSLAGPGGGPEVLDSYQPESDRELVLAYLAQKGNADAKEMLSEIQRQKQRPQAMMQPPAQEPLPEEASLDAFPEDEE